MFYPNLVWITIISIPPIYLLDRYYSKKRKTTKQYILTFIAMIILSAILSAIPAYSVETIAGEIGPVETIAGWTDDFIHFECDAIPHQTSKMLTPSLEAEINKKIQYHKTEGQKKFKAAHEKCPLFPYKTEADAVNRIFQIAMNASINALSGARGLVAAVIAQVAIQVQHHSQEYFEMMALLEESKIHFQEMHAYHAILENHR